MEDHILMIVGNGMVIVCNVLAVGIGWGKLNTRVQALQKHVMNGLTHKVEGLCTDVAGINATCTERGKRWDEYIDRYNMDDRRN